MQTSSENASMIPADLLAKIPVGQRAWWEKHLSPEVIRSILAIPPREQKEIKEKAHAVVERRKSEGTRPMSDCRPVTYYTDSGMYRRMEWRPDYR